MVKSKPAYKIGDCLIHRRTKQVVIIVEIKSFGATGLRYTVKCVDDRLPELFYRFLLKGSTLQLLYKKIIFSPMAQLLYSNKVTTNQGVKNETNEK